MKRTLLCLALAGCGDTGQQAISYPMLAVGGGHAPFDVGGWQVELDRAQLGLGPIYFCASAGASDDLCPAALGELADTVSLDLLTDTPVVVGQIEGLTGDIRSVTYDYALTWLLTESEPKAHAGAPGGHAARFHGIATKAGASFAFTADIDVTPLYRGTFTVQGHRVSSTVDDDRIELTVAADPRLWLGQVDFDDAAAAAVDGQVTFAPGSRSYNAIVLAMTANATPTFTWTPTP